MITFGRCAESKRTMTQASSGENKRKHLDFIQSVTTRMAGNLFFLKGWAITLIVGLFALAAKDAKPRFYFVAYAVAAILWILDGYFLRQERLFRALYDQVRQIDEGDIDFSLDTKPFVDLPRNSLLRCTFSLTLVLFYASLLAIMLFVTFSRD